MYIKYTTATQNNNLPIGESSRILSDTLETIFENCNAKSDKFGNKDFLLIIENYLTICLMMYLYIHQTWKMVKSG